MRSSSSRTSRPAAVGDDEHDHDAEERRDHGEDRADDAVAGGVGVEEARDVDGGGDGVEREQHGADDGEREDVLAGESLWR